MFEREPHASGVTLRTPRGEPADFGATIDVGDDGQVWAHIATIGGAKGFVEYLRALADALERETK